MYIVQRGYVTIRRPNGYGVFYKVDGNKFKGEKKSHVDIPTPKKLLLRMLKHLD